MNKNLNGPTNSEGLEGETVNVYNNNLIPDDYTRCNNYDCTIKDICSRFLQRKIDDSYEHDKDFYTATFFQFKSNLELEDWNPETESCNKFIKFTGYGV
jgi:hypothetical protein